ncbi:unnamed protein product [Cuscuta campestris]|uniref:N-acetyltransferase domain-containing protein n=1 Tax=Cuscuta campestris TaxID=132261 RepID=A0A484MJJ7_9ASTE|nr:unnamed protein product [Cuscuta campestris]
MDSDILGQKRSKREDSPSQTVSSDEEGGGVGSAGYSVAATISIGEDSSKKQLAETTDLLNIPSNRSGSSQTEDSPLQTEIFYGEGSAGCGDASIAAGGGSTAAISSGEESSRRQLTQVVTAPDLLRTPLTDDSAVKIENVGDESPGVRSPGRTDATIEAGLNSVWISTKEHSLIREENAGMLKFFCFSTGGDNASDVMDWLSELKAIFSKQLPKLPTEYIDGVVMNSDHKTTMAVRLNQVIGGITYRPHMSQKFGEIAFCAIAEEKRFRGYGTRLMTKTKQRACSEGLTHLLTYADDNAIDYFIKQGFTKEIHMEKNR